MTILEQLKRYGPYNEQEEKDKPILLDFMQKDNAWERSNLVAHFTASAWVVNETFDKVLMCYHNLYDSWSWLGGHADGEKDLLAVAIKEVKEESGLTNVIALQEDIFSIEIVTVDGHIKKGAYVPSHLHLNVTYLLQAKEEEKLFIKPDENKGLQWFSLDGAIEASSEPWFQQNIYSKLNEKLRREIEEYESKS